MIRIIIILAVCSCFPVEARHIACDASEVLETALRGQDGAVTLVLAMIIIIIIIIMIIIIVIITWSTLILQAAVLVAVVRLWSVTMESRAGKLEKGV